MDKYTKLFLVTLVIVTLALAGTWFYLNKGKTKEQPVNTETQFPANPQKGDFGYNEPKTKVSIGSEGILGGNFVKVENGTIYVKTNTGQVQYPLVTDQVGLACTKQDLVTARELDYELVDRIVQSSPGDIGSLIPASQAIVVFAQDVEGTLRVHTVALATDKCPSE